MLTSENTDKLFEALAAAQAELGNPNKTRTAKVKGETKTGAKFEYEYKYADIADVLNDARPVLAKHGLCVVQATGIEGQAVLIRTRLGHASGQWLESEYPVAAINGDHQKMGAALTYSRRYALCALIGVAAEEDVDGQGADEQRAPDRRPEPKRADPQPPTLAERASRLERSMNDAKNADDVRKAWNLATKLREDLDRGDPERLVELEKLFGDRVAALEVRAAA